MKLFLDTANIEQINKANAYGILDGITTNPSLIAKEGADHAERILEICQLVDGDVSAEVVETEAEAMVTEGRKLAKIHDNVVVKVPLTRDGIKATKMLSSEEIRVNVTLCFYANQALLAAKAGAYYISPFVGRLDDLTIDGMELIRDIVTIYENYDYSTQVLTASARGPLHVRDAALCGAHVVTLPYGVFEKLFDHPLTDIGLAQFLADYRKSQER
jgi:transaldolase